MTEMCNSVRNTIKPWSVRNQAWLFDKEHTTTSRSLSSVHMCVTVFKQISALWWHHHQAVQRMANVWNLLIFCLILSASRFRRDFCSMSGRLSSSSCDAPLIQCWTFSSAALLSIWLRSRRLIKRCRRWVGTRWWTNRPHTMGLNKSSQPERERERTHTYITEKKVWGRFWALCVCVCVSTHLEL